MMVQHVRRCREFTGPTPNSVAILAKPTKKRPVEHIVLETRKKDELREQFLADTKYQKQCDLKSEWERVTDKRIQQNTVTRRVERLLQRETFSLEDRRERLRELLSTEEQNYVQEMEAKEETTLERQAKMRERAKFLKAKREQERLKLVEEKLDQRWREECEELRATLSRRQRDDVFTERHEQLRMKAEQKKRDEEIEKLYADMWEQDRQVKALREEKTAQGQMERNRETLRVLQLQSAATAQKKDEELKLKEMEAEWMKEEATIRMKEEEWLKGEKIRKQKAAKRARDISIQLKKEKEAKEKQEELALDMKILEKLLEDTKNEATEEAQRKAELREENLRFMEYCAMNRKEMKEREKELERLVNEEVQKQWGKRMTQYQMERDARKKLMANVMKTREQQMQERVQKAKEEEEASRLEREAQLAAIEEHKRLEAENQERLMNRNKTYQRDLDMQIDYQKRTKAQRKEEEVQDFLLGQKAEGEYQQKLKKALERTTPVKAHPMRLAVSGKSIQRSSSH